MEREGGKKEKRSARREGKGGEGVALGREGEEDQRSRMTSMESPSCVEREEVKRRWKSA